MSNNEFFQKRAEEWLPGAMFPSEIWWLYKNIVAAKPDILIECGRQDGYSTYLLAQLLSEHGIKIYSIDFDEDKARLAGIVAKLAGYNVECVSGDIHIKVPELLLANKDKRIAIVQDGPKGWEGIATLMAATLGFNVVLCAQHNLHRGHLSRKYFQLVSRGATFLEFSDEAEIKALREKEIGFLATKNSNRDLDHSSLGVSIINDDVRGLIRENIVFLDGHLGVWSAVSTLAQWESGKFDHVSRIRQRQKYRLYRFKQR